MVGVHNNYPTLRSHGFSIIELMVAMGLSLLLLAGVLTVFSTSRSTYETNDRLARLEENGRFALDAMVRDIRASGYLGCSHDLPEGNKQVSTLNKPTGMTLAADYDTTYAALGYEYTGSGLWSPTLDTTWVVSAANGSDVLLIRQPRTDVQALGLASSMTKQTDNLNVTKYPSGNGPFNNHQVVLISNCVMRSYFEITDYDAKNGVIKHEKLAAAGDGSYLGNSTNDLGWVYTTGNAADSDQADATLISLQTVIYYVRPSTSGNGNSLWRRVDTNSPEELVEGVDAMQLLFGIDTTDDGIVDKYDTANNVIDPNSIVTVSIALLLRSLDEYGTVDKDTKTYDLLGNKSFTAPGDHRLRQVFSTTATIRNSAS